ncbi:MULTISPECIES: efflux RND transporter periplasmic adaptor subunit [unclassified Mesorhizobium]|uniref:efflux RND transporter periplasmic adaptor subunit n=1 Tax=unclassified Mesorhizobium TaxID=325217 RepID=UPI0030152286
MALRGDDSSRLFPTVAFAVALMLLQGCSEQKQSGPETILNVKAIEAETVDYRPRFALTGQVTARNEARLSFEVGGQVTEVLADVGVHVEAGALLARLDPKQQNSDVASAEAGVDAAQAQLAQSTAAFERQKSLLAGGFTTKSTYDNAAEAVDVAKGTLETNKAQLSIARKSVADTELKAQQAGIVSTRNIEVGQVVQATQTVFIVAVDGPRDAVFQVQEQVVAHMPEDPQVQISLLSDPEVKTTGHVREVAPSIDPTTGTVQVKVALDQTPARMTLGEVVLGTAPVPGIRAFVIPWSAMMIDNGKPAVWTVDAASNTAGLAPITVDRYETGRIIVRDGLKDGDLVVTEGAQLLRAGAKVSMSLEGAQ